MSTRPLMHPRDEIVQTIERIYRYKMTTTSGGNVSIRDEAGDVWITPTRIDKGSLRREDIVCLHPDGSVSGLPGHKPSSEYPFHLDIYRARPDLNAVVHAHPVALVAFSMARQVPNTALFPQAAQICSPVGFAPYELPGSAALGQRIAAVFAQPCNSAILENHGVAIGGTDLQSAFERFETLEFTAKTILKASHLRGGGSIRYLTPEQLALSQRPFTPLPEFEPGPATTEEKAVRYELCAFLRRAYQQRIMISTEGSFSARVGADAFVISSYGIDRKSVLPEELTLVAQGRREEGKRPSRAAAIHQAIYRAHPEARAIVNATPVNATAFAVTAHPLDVRTIPESYIFLRDVVTVPFAAQFSDGSEIAALVSPGRRPAALLENNGVLVLGTSTLDAFDRLEVLEATAEAMINALTLGPVHPIEDERIDALISAFKLPR